MNKTITQNKIISTIAKRFLAAAVLAIGLTANANAQSLCGPQFTYTVGAAGQVSFTGSSVGTSTNCNYSWVWWSSTGNGSSAQQSPTITFPYNGTYNVGLSISDSSTGCSGSVSDSVVITNALTCNLAAAYTYTTGASGLVNFTDASTGVDPGMIYNWNWYGPSGSGSSNLQSPAITFAYNGTYTVTLSVGDPTNTCYKSTTNTVVITNSQPCQVSFTYSVGAGGQVTFTNTSLGNSIYYWNFGDGTNSTATSPTHTYYNGTYSVNMWADTSSGCGGSAMDSIVITTGSPAPTCTSAFTYTLGANGQVDFTNTSTGTVAHPFYLIDFGDGYSDSIATSVNHTYIYNGSYNVNLMEKDSMTYNVICSYNTTINITNAAGGGCHDTVSFVMYKDTATFGAWYVYLVNNTSTTPVRTTWYWGDGSSDTTLYPSHTYASPGWYSVCVRAYYACGDSSYYCQSDSLYRASAGMVSVTVINSNAVGIKTFANNPAAVKIYPNPFADNLTIDVNAAAGSAVTYAIYTMYGEQIAAEKVSLNKGENKIGINTSAINSGMYFVTITDANKKTQTFKIVK